MLRNIVVVFCWEEGVNVKTQYMLPFDITERDGKTVLARNQEAERCASMSAAMSAGIKWIEDRFRFNPEYEYRIASCLPWEYKDSMGNILPLCDR